MISECPIKRGRWHSLNMERTVNINSTSTRCRVQRPGARRPVFSLLLYLDEPEEGDDGLPRLGLRIRPETGTALLSQRARAGLRTFWSGDA